MIKVNHTFGENLVYYFKKTLSERLQTNDLEFSVVTLFKSLRW